MTVSDEVLKIVRELQAQAAQHDLADASGFLVVVFDPELGRRTSYGPYVDVMQAMADSDRLLTSLNSGDDEDVPFQVSVELLFPPVDPPRHNH